MVADPSLMGWGGRSAPPPHAGGGRAAIQRRMNLILLRQAKRLRRAHVPTTVDEQGERGMDLGLRHRHLAHRACALEVKWKRKGRG
jgi:hypothetical protein